MITYEEAIEELKRRYHNNEVSALVGAGFSKNIYQAFPLWNELLHDMIMELYRPEIRKSFQYQPGKGGSLKAEYAAHCQRKIKEIINREGYLGIVSHFIEKRGFREAVEVYIEQRIPHVNETSSTLDVLKEKREIALTDNCFDAHTKLLEGAWDNIYTTNYDRLLEFSARRAGKQWNTIKRAQDLSFSKQTKAIIKLHGDLCRPDEHSFEFDGNCHHRYVISQEDYRNYPTEHEAFTQLMRISLLQGTFCLFGFSGDDPNFTSWLRWVRDILVMQREETEEGQPVKRIKIFLIDMTAKCPSADKQLFYNNHHIFHIPLLNEEVRKLLGASEISNPKELIIRFLTYLYKQESKNYQTLWSKVFSSRSISNTQPWQKAFTIDESVLQEINRMKPSNRMVTDIHWQERFLHEVYVQKELGTAEIDLMLTALEDTYYQPEYYRKLMETIDNGPALTPRQQERLQKLFERSSTLHAAAPEEEADGDYYRYEQILRHAFRLDFTGLHKALSAWEPQGVYLMRRALFMAFFDKEEAKNQLLAYIDRTLEIKERYYATELLNLIDLQFPQRYSTAKYENQNLKGLYDLEKAFVKKATLTKESTKPYGCQQTSHRIGQENSRYEASVRVLQFLVEAPLCTAYNGVYTLNANDWYKIFLNLFEYFPYPALFYSLQYGTEDVLRRIGQEYAYSDSDSIRELLPNLQQKLLGMYINPDTPRWMRDNALVVAGELLVAVKPGAWEDQFMAIWTDYIVLHYPTWATHDKAFKFACEGLKYLRSKTHTTQIIKDCLEQAQQNRDASIYFLYYLKRKPKSEALSEPIDCFIRRINNAGDFVIAGNIYEVLSPAHIRQLAVTMKEVISKKEHIPEIAFRALAYFSHQSRQNRDLVKQAILNSSHLWDNGLQPKGGASAPTFIELSQLKKDIDWPKEELESLYRKLRESFHSLAESQWMKESKEHIFPLHYNELLKEMSTFLKDYAKELSAQEDYLELREEIHKALQRELGFTDVCEALVSDDNSLVIRATNQMYEEFPKLRQVSGYKEFDLLIDRIVFKRKEGLRGCLALLAYYLKTKNPQDSLSTVQLERIALIPRLYTSAVLRQLDMELPAATRHIADIAEALKKAGYDSDAIKQWMDMKKSHRFNTL
ncbi:MAG: SIR2 family protein [Paraprevotella sp.]|nr:SIR2 family protein [Paraprevotella sp.]